MTPIAIIMVVLFALWTVLLLVMTVGIYRWGNIFRGKAQLTDYKADDVRGSDFYKRAMRAHANCVENLPVFVAVVFGAYATNSITHTVDTLSVVAVVARVLQSLVHVSVVQTNRVVLLRFVLFFAQLVCFAGIGVVALMNWASAA